MVVKDSEFKRHSRNAVSGSDHIWPEGIVPYTITDVFTGKSNPVVTSSFSFAKMLHFTDDEKRIILQAMRHWEDCTCIRFKEKTEEDEYSITFITGNQRE